MRKQAPRELRRGDPAGKQVRAAGMERERTWIIYFQEEFWLVLGRESRCGGAGGFFLGRESFVLVLLLLLLVPLLVLLVLPLVLLLPLLLLLLPLHIAHAWGTNKKAKPSVPYLAV